MQVAARWMNNAKVTGGEREGSIKLGDRPLQRPVIWKGDGPALSIVPGPERFTYAVLVEERAVVEAHRIDQAFDHHRIDYEGGWLELAQDREQALKPRALVKASDYLATGPSGELGRIPLKSKLFLSATVELPGSIPFEARLLAGWLAVRSGASGDSVS